MQQNMSIKVNCFALAEVCPRCQSKVGEGQVHFCGVDGERHVVMSQKTFDEMVAARKIRMVNFALVPDAISTLN